MLGHIRDPCTKNEHEDTLGVVLSGCPTGDHLDCLCPVASPVIGSVQPPQVARAGSLSSLVGVFDEAVHRDGRIEDRARLLAADDWQVCFVEQAQLY